jgi:hypothetical protein
MNSLINFVLFDTCTISSLNEISLCSYHKTESVVKATAEKTSSLFSGFTSKLSQMKNSDSFKSFEQSVGGAYESVKTKVSTSRSGSVQSFNDIASSANNTAPGSPIMEEKPIV